MLSVTSRLTPAAMARGIRKLPFGGRALDTAYSVYEYVAWKPNPLLQIVYATLVFGGYGVAIIEAYPRISQLIHALLAQIYRIDGALSDRVLLGKCARPARELSRQGTGKKFDNYAFDSIIYMPERNINSEMGPAAAAFQACTVEIRQNHEQCHQPI